MSTLPANPYPRTTCACPQCQQCCRDQPGPLIPGDLERIAGYLGETIRTVSVKFWASPGGRLLLGDRLSGRVEQVAAVPTITPKKRAGGCVFLDREGRCRIHPVAPFGCAYFDTHMTAEEGRARGLWMMAQQMTPEYQTLRRTLDEATSWRPKL